METIWTYWIHTSWWRMVTSSPCFLGSYSVIHRYYAVPSSRPPSVFVSSFELLLRRIFHFLCFLSGYRNVWMDGEVMRRRKGKAESEHLLPNSALHSLSEHENSCAMKVVQQSDLPDENWIWTMDTTRKTFHSCLSFSGKLVRLQAVLIFSTIVIISLVIRLSKWLECHGWMPPGAGCRISSIEYQYRNLATFTSVPCIRTAAGLAPDERISPSVSPSRRSPATDRSRCCGQHTARSYAPYDVLTWGGLKRKHWLFCQLIIA